MPQWMSEALEKSNYFMPHGHCYLWLPGLLWLHVASDVLIGVAYLAISVILYVLVRTIRLPFSPIFIAFGLFIGLCGVTHFMKVWTVWNPDYLLEGLIKGATAAASVATAIGLFFVKPRIEDMVYAARLSDERQVRLEGAHAELEALYNKVKQLDALRSELFANVSHELRTPLALILGPAERMLADPNLSLDQRRQLDSIRGNGKTLLKHVNDLLDVAKLDSGKMEIAYARVDVVPLFRRIASQFDVAAEQQQLQFQINAPDQLLVEADPDMLERILINLLSNAFKFTPDGGAVRLALVVGENQAGENQFSLSVADTGPGICLDQQASVFERFRQVDGGATRAFGGTGLGLAIVNDLVTLHQGRVELGASPEGGVHLSVNLPLVAPPGVQVAPSAPLPMPATQVALEGTLHELSAQAGQARQASSKLALPVNRARPCVLVVEDNPEMRAFVSDTLAEQYNVITAADGQEGLERALLQLPDLIISDLMMPRMSGDQLVAAIRTHGELASVPILLLSARTDDALRIALLSHGAQDYLTKPFLPQELQARAGNLVAMKRAGDALRTALSSVSGDVEMMAGELSDKHRQLLSTLDATGVAREQAERASQVKSLFLSMVSHELRTPLSTISMNVQMFMRSESDGADEVARARLERVARATRQMQTLIDDLLEYVRVESGRIETQIEPIDTLLLAQDVLDLHLPFVPPNVDLTLELTAPGLQPFRTDPRLLRVILSNLIANALKFTRDGTVVVRLDQDRQGQLFEVSDTGKGFAESEIPRMFLPFEQLEPIRSKSAPGFGLGLALVKQIVDALGGRMVVRSSPDVGSSFLVHLPFIGQDQVVESAT